MLIFDLRDIGNNMLAHRKKSGLTQAELAEIAGISDRTYADIERGTVNMRLQTLLKICEGLGITPDDILVSEDHSFHENELIEYLQSLPKKKKDLALKFLTFFIDSI